eukprot:16437435-Heterocapsa_arctica.AAC.1
MHTPHVSNRRVSWATSVSGGACAFPFTFSKLLELNDLLSVSCAHFFPDFSRDAVGATGAFVYVTNACTIVPLGLSLTSVAFLTGVTVK